MGKKQIAQGVKNNYKSSSSAKTQLSLNTTDTYSVIPELKFPISDILDSDFQVVLKKMNKKYFATKQKALIEFSTLCDFKDEDTVKAVSSPWITQYVTLCKDNEPCIREGAQKAMHSFLNRVQRNVAPYLKTFFAHWFVAQFDTDPSTASLATSMFENTFPLNKRIQVIVFCQKEIFVYLIENITNSAVLNIKAESDEINETHIRTATSCLYATSTFLSLTGHIEQIESDFKSMLLTNSTYWKLNKHPTPSVRQAWYTLLHSILLKSQRFLQDECKKVTFAIFDNVDEDNFAVSLVIWKNILLVVSKSELNDFWLQSSAEKIFLPKLWKVLVCTKGCISSAYENILELCKHCPVLNTIEIKEFHFKCINSIIQGLEKMSGRFDRTNFVSGVETLFEIVTLTLRNNCEDELFAYNVISEVLNLVKFSLTGKLSNAMTSPVVFHLAVFLEFLSKDNSFHVLKNTIWNTLNTILIGSGLTDEMIVDNILCQLQVHLIVFKQLRSPMVMKDKNNLRVTFEETNTNEMLSSSILYCNEDYKIDLENVVTIVLHFYLNKTTNPEVGHLYANHMCQVILAFKNYDVDKKLSRILPVKNIEALSSSTFRLYEKYVKTWISDNKVLTYYLVSVIIRLLESIEKEEEQVIMINDLNLFGLNVVLEEIMKYISEGNTLPEIISNWLETVPMQNEFKKFISIDVDENKSKLLVDSLKFKENVCIKWMKILLKSVYTNPTSSLIIMLRQIFEKNSNDQSFFNIHLDLIFNIMECLISTYLEKTLDGGDCKDRHELGKTWKLLLNNMLDTHNNEVMKRCSLVITNYVQLMENNIEDVEIAVDQFIGDFVLCSKQNNLPGRFVYELFKHIYNIDHSKVIICCEIASYIDGSLSYTGNNRHYADTSGECFHTVYAIYSHMYVFTKQLLKVFIKSEQLPDKSDINEQFVNIMVNTICNANVIANLLKKFSNRKYCCKIKSSVFEIIKTNVAALIQLQPKVVAFYIINKIIEKTIIYGPYWSKSLEFTLDMLSLPTEELITLYKSAMLKYSDSSNCIHIIQIFVSLCGWSNLECDHFSLADTRCVWNVHFMKTANSEIITQMQKVLDFEEKLFTSDIECLTQENKMIDTIRNIEFLNSVFFSTEPTFILKYSKTIYNRLKYLMSNLANIDDFHNGTYLPIGIIVTLAATLFEKIMKFYRDEVYNNVQPDDVNLITFKSDTKLLHTCLLQIWIKLLNKCNNIIHELVLESLSSCITYLEFEEICQKDLFSLCLNLINSDCYIIEITAYTILERLCELHSDYVETDTENDQVPFELSVLPLQRLQNLVSTMLTDIKIGNTFEPEPFTINFKNTRVYLFLWNLIFKLCSKLEYEERYNYISHLKDDNSISYLMKNLLNLMPNLIIKTYSSNNFKELFNLRPNCTPVTYWNNKKLWHLVCWTYYNLLHTLPAVVRKWWVNSEHKVSTLVDKLTIKYVSQNLIIQELQHVKQAKKIDNIVVNMSESRGIIFVSYVIEDKILDMAIHMANNHPLGTIKISSDKHLNGSILHGIRMWQLYINKKLDGAEECYICYSILHDSTYELSKIVCNTCSKKFHETCLHKWFNTINKPTCPVCRYFF